MSEPDPADRAALSRDPAESRVALAEISQVVDLIEPESPAEEDLRAAMRDTVRLLQSLHAGCVLRAAMRDTVRLLQSLHAGCVLLETANEQAWGLLSKLWKIAGDGGDVTAARKLSELRPAIERLQPQAEPQRRLRAAMLEACSMLDARHMGALQYQEMIERAWRGRVQPSQAAVRRDAARDVLPNGLHVMSLHPLGETPQDPKPFRCRFAVDLRAPLGVSASELALELLPQPHVPAEELDRHLPNRPPLQGALRLDLAVQIVGEFHRRLHVASKPYSCIPVKNTSSASPLTARRRRRTMEEALARS
ncbi:MAG: hypothetical protein GY719_17580 [bacterium]|nr:hypothetical protein [bacterium]